MRDSLFRQQVLDEQKHKNLGQVLIRPPAAVQAIVWLLTAIMVVSILFLAFGQYNRREKAIGILVPQRGAIKIHASRSGVISAVHIRDGQLVKQNEPLFSLTSDKILPTGEAVTQTTLADLQNLMENLKARIAALPAEEEAERATMNADLAQHKNSFEMLQNQKKLIQKRLGMRRESQQKSKPLADEKLISNQDYQQLTEAVLTAQGQLHEADQAILANEAMQRNLEAKIQRLPSEFAIQKGNLLQQLTEASTQIADLNLQKEQVLVSPIAGQVTNIQAYPGMEIDVRKPLAIVLPEGNQLEAHLFVASRAIGFVKSGQKVLLQYEAFPSHKYGVQIGRIVEISHSALNPSEINEMEMSAQNEAYYRLTVALEKNNIRAFQQDIPLKSGMRIQADIVLEKRSLMEWILEPLYRARG